MVDNGKTIVYAHHNEHHESDDDDDETNVLFMYNNTQCEAAPHVELHRAAPAPRVHAY